MISVIISIYNRAHLLKWCLEAIHRQDFYQNIEINILDDGSTDNLDSILAEYSNKFELINKYILNRDDEKVKFRRFNCPAEAYNILVKLSKYNVIYKTDPECVILDPLFLRNSVTRIVQNPTMFILPFTSHCYDFEINAFFDIENNYKKFVYPTHITRDTVDYYNVYYQAVFSKPYYIKLGGVDERFMDGIGSEDDHFLYQWRKHYGTSSVLTLLDAKCVHLYHGGMASGPSGVPSELHKWVMRNANLYKMIKEETPNQHNTWGTLYSNIEHSQWAGGALKKDRELLSLPAPAPPL